MSVSILKRIKNQAISLCNRLACFALLHRGPLCVPGREEFLKVEGQAVFSSLGPRSGQNWDAWMEELPSRIDQEAQYIESHLKRDRQSPKDYFLYYASLSTYLLIVLAGRILSPGIGCIQLVYEFKEMLALDFEQTLRTFVQKNGNFNESVNLKKKIDNWLHGSYFVAMQTQHQIFSSGCQSHVVLSKEVLVLIEACIWKTDPTQMDATLEQTRKWNTLKAYLIKISQDPKSVSENSKTSGLSAHSKKESFSMSRVGLWLVSGAKKCGKRLSNALKGPYEKVAQYIMKKKDAFVAWKERHIMMNMLLEWMGLSIILMILIVIYIPLGIALVVWRWIKNVFPYYRHKKWSEWHSPFHLKLMQRSLLLKECAQAGRELSVNAWLTEEDRIDHQLLLFEYVQAMRPDFLNGFRAELMKVLSERRRVNGNKPLVVQPEIYDFFSFKNKIFGFPNETQVLNYHCNDHHIGWPISHTNLHDIKGRLNAFLKSDEMGLDAWFSEIIEFARWHEAYSWAELIKNWDSPIRKCAYLSTQERSIWAFELLNLESPSEPGYWSEDQKTQRLETTESLIRRVFLRTRQRAVDEKWPEFIMPMVCRDLVSLGMQIELRRHPVNMSRKECETQWASWHQRFESHRMFSNDGLVNQLAYSVMNPAIKSSYEWIMGVDHPFNLENFSLKEIEALHALHGPFLKIIMNAELENAQVWMKKEDVESLINHPWLGEKMHRIVKGSIYRYWSLARTQQEALMLEKSLSGSKEESGPGMPSGSCVQNIVEPKKRMRL